MLSIGLHTLRKTNSETNYLFALKSNSDVPARYLMIRYGLMEKYNLQPSALVEERIVSGDLDVRHFLAQQHHTPDIPLQG